MKHMTFGEVVRLILVFHSICMKRIRALKLKGAAWTIENGVLKGVSDDE